MLKYIVILLDDTSVSYCHYENNKTTRKLIDLNTLKSGILFAMKENLSIQFIYPNYELPIKYKEVIHSIDHSKIIPYGCPEDGDITVLDGYEEYKRCLLDIDTAYVLRISKEDLFKNCEKIKLTIGKVARLNIVITNLEKFENQDFEIYNSCLKTLSGEIEHLYAGGRSPQLNLLTDRMILESMNNCNAGCETITLAPDGRFYICPAFYFSGEDEDYGLGKSKFDVGHIESGITIKNPQLYKLAYAPLCRRCDSYQCRRCVWLNRKMTYELNTPSHEQCVVSHLERNASRELLMNIRKYGEFLPDHDITEITYLDPFEIRKRELENL